MPEIINILHLSDLHFGMEKSEKIPATAVDQRNNTLKELIKTLAAVDKKWKPDVVAISGDIGWKGLKKDYTKAEKWLIKDLLSTLGLPPEKLVVCPGNHDLDRNETIGMLPPPSEKEADEWLQAEHLKKFSEPFKPFSAFCKNIKIKTPELGTTTNYLTGIIDMDSFRFVVLNSAWFCRGDEDKDKLWLGKPLLEKMVNHDQLIDTDAYDAKKSPVTIVLFHHPPEWLAEKDFNTFTNRQCAMEYLSLRSHILLTGHVHARPAEPDRKNNRAWLVKGGAMYAGNDYQNHFSILKINTKNRSFSRLAWEFDPGKNKWLRDSDLKETTVYNLTIAESSPSASSAQLIIPGKYKEWVIAQCRDMDITKLAGKSSVIRVGLPEIYIPLFTTPTGADKAKRSENPEAGEEWKLLAKEHQDIEELIPKNRTLVIRGRAGSGKTTLVKHAAHSMITRGTWKGLDEYLPVLVFLKDLKGFDTTGVTGNVDTAEKLLAFWTEKAGSFLNIDIIQAYCDAGKVVFFLDGLDEIDEHLREIVTKAFHGVKIKHEKCKIVFSGRPHGVDDPVVKWFGTPIDILPLLMPQVEDFIHKWFEHVFDNNTSKTMKTAPDLIGEIRSHPSIDELIDSPLMLTAICLLYNDDKELPGQRAELYDRFITNLLYKRFGSEAQKVRNFLMVLGKNTHEKNTKIISRVDALKVLGNDYKKEKDETQTAYNTRLDEKFDEIEPACGLLKCEKGGYGFIHLTFQEFLTANALIAGETENHFNTIQRYWDNSWYLEVVRLYIGYLSIQNKSLANTIVTKILEENDKIPFARHLLAIRAFNDIHRDNREDYATKLVKDTLWEIIDSDAKPPVRAEAGELLGRMGDDRDFETFVTIPDCTYKTSAGSVTLKSFEMGRFPVTNLWFRKFIEDKAYKRQELWSKEGKKWLADQKEEYPEYWYDHQWNSPNHPVVGVSWHEADAFCRWLTTSRNDGYTYRLPKAQEWEAAAAGKAGREYAWGNEFDADKCNTHESGINKTSAVGIFKNGDTPDGLSDLSGNVSEWTCTNYDTKKKQPIFKNSVWVTGGVWGIGSISARCDSRYYKKPDTRDYLIGFRCSRTKI